MFFRNALMAVGLMMPGLLVEIFFSFLQYYITTFSLMSFIFLGSSKGAAYGS